MYYVLCIMYYVLCIMYAYYYLVLVILLSYYIIIIIVDALNALSSPSFSQSAGGALSELVSPVS